MRWKKLYENYHSQLQLHERMFQNEAEGLEKEMEQSIEDFEINKIKQGIDQSINRPTDHFFPNQIIFPNFPVNIQFIWYF